jgi:isopropylmalate/homocitrate/citramalate synthase
VRPFPTTPRHPSFKLIKDRDFKIGKPKIHVNNDFGLVVANNMFAVVNGVKMNHVAVSDIRERTGTASLEQTVIAINCSMVLSLT